MLSRLQGFFRTGPDRPRLGVQAEELRRLYERKRWSVFVSVTLGYGCFYTCRVNLSVVKKPMLDEGVLSATELGLIGSGLLVVYAVAKLVNGFLADRCNIARFMSSGLLLSALANLAFGSTRLFAVFAVLWGLNGLFQSVGSAPSVVALSQWFSGRERGTRYGIWSASHSLGEGFTFAVTAVLVSSAGWRWGFWGPGLLGVAAALVMFRTLADRPETYGLPPVWEYKNDPPPVQHDAATVGAQQREVLRNPAVWILGLASASIYVARYGMDHWGVFFLQEAKGYSLREAGTLMATYPILGLVGSITAGLVSDRFFGSRRHPPAILLGLVEIAALAALFAVPPGHLWLDALALAAFGYALGGQVVFLGGLMAVDLCSTRATGAAMGLIGVFSYAGAAIQDTVSGRLIDLGKHVVDGRTIYSFAGVERLWVGASVLALLLTLATWRRKAPHATTI